MSVTSIDTGPLPPGTRRIGTWALQAVVAAVFFAAGVAKLAAVPFEVQLFAQIGLGQWFRIVTGAVLLVGAFALVYPRLAAIGGLWLGFTMFCGVVVNLAVLHISPAPPIMLALLNALIVYLRRDELASLVGTLLGQVSTRAMFTRKLRVEGLGAGCQTFSGAQGVTCPASTPSGSGNLSAELGVLAQTPAGRRLHAGGAQHRGGRHT